MSDKKCSIPASFRYTWPGQNERLACFLHAMQVAHVAGAMGFSIQIIRLEADDLSESTICSHDEVPLDNEN